MTTNEPGQQPAPHSGDDQPTVPFTPADQQSTAAYPPAYDAAQQPAYGAPQPGYGAPQQPPYGAPQQSAGPDTRPKKLGLIALITALAGLVLVLAGFIPVLWVGFTFAIIGGLLLLVALVLGIVTLVNRTQGGKGLGIGAIVVSVIGGAVWVAALTFSLVLIGLSAAGNSGDSEPIEIPSPQVSVEGEDEGTTDDGATDGATTADEAAFVAEVRPQLIALFQEIQPGMTEELLESVYSDEILVATGQGFLMGGDAARQAFVTATSSSGDTMTADQANRFVDIMIAAAEVHLAG